MFPADEGEIELGTASFFRPLATPRKTTSFIELPQILFNCRKLTEPETPDSRSFTTFTNLNQRERFCFWQFYMLLRNMNVGHQRRFTVYNIYRFDSAKL